MNLVNKCVGFGVVLVAIATACAAPTIPNDVGEEEGNQTANKPKKENSKPAPKQDTDKNEPAPKGEEPPGEEPPKGSDPPPPAGNCGASTTAEACFTCCDPTNAAEAAFIAWDKCACQTPGVCAAQCGTSYCAGQQPTPACETCLKGATQCNAVGDAACNAACQAAFTCVETSKCEEKP